jgi:hypothetical protein
VGVRDADGPVILCEGLEYSLAVRETTIMQMCR